MSHQLCGDIQALLRAAPHAVDSFAPGHWELMSRLERSAPEVVARRDVLEAAGFLAEVSYLKRPHTIDQNTVRRALLDCPQELSAALDALARVEELDYAAMEVVARLPGFGRSGGRSFNSAVFRLVRPGGFGIIDWRNVAVLCCSPGFEGLVKPRAVFRQFSPEAVVLERGHLPFTPDVYRQYNDALRSLAGAHRLRVADVDLILWTYSIQQQAFPRFTLPLMRSTISTQGIDRESLRRDHHPLASQLVATYLARLRETGYLSREQVSAELCAVFALIRDECEAFGRTKRGKFKDRVARVVMTLTEAIASGQPARLIAQWQRWQDMVDPASPGWIGISLPSEMILGGFLVLEDFIPVKQYIESYYKPALEPKYTCD